MEKNKKNNFYIFGSGGHAKSCIDVIESNNLNKIIAVIYKKKKPLHPFFSRFKLINEDELDTNYKNLNALVGIGQIKSNIFRKDVFKLIKKKNLLSIPYAQQQHTFQKHPKLIKEQL